MERSPRICKKKRKGKENREIEEGEKEYKKMQMIEGNEDGESKVRQRKHMLGALLI